MTGSLGASSGERLALMALCGELVIAIDAMAIVQLRSVAETASRDAGHGMSVLDLDGELVAGWDLGELLGMPPCHDAWVLTQLPGIARPVAFRIGRCIVVHALPPCRPVPGGIFTARAGAITAGFAALAAPLLAEHVSGVVVDLARVLDAGERERSQQVAGAVA